MKRAAPAFWFLAGLLTALILPHARAGILDDFSGVYATDSVITTATARLPYQSVMTFRVHPSGRAGSLSTTGFVNANGTTFNLRNQFQINGGRFAVQTIAPPSNYSPADGTVDFNRRQIQGRADLPLRCRVVWPLHRPPAKVENPRDADRDLFGLRRRGLCLPDHEPGNADDSVRGRRPRGAAAGAAPRAGEGGAG